MVGVLEWSVTEPCWRPLEINGQSIARRCLNATGASIYRD